MDSEFTLLFYFEAKSTRYSLCRAATNELCLFQEEHQVRGPDKQALQVLEHLALAENRFLLKLALHDLVWLGQKKSNEKEKRQRVDTEISNLRHMLGDCQPWEVIESVAPHQGDDKSGYRFTPHVTRFEQDKREHNTVEATRTSMEEFFGARVWSQDPEARKGVIILRADPISELIDGWAHQERKPDGLHRVHTARRWINACDADGAQAIITQFQDYKINAPVLSLTYQSFPHDTSNALFEITMGGRTDKTKNEVNKIGKGWMTLIETEESGDALSLHKAFASYTDRFHAVPVEGDFLRLLPSDWGATYIDNWLKKISKPTIKPVRDYAVIIRRTIDDIRSASEGKHRKILFYLFGFSEVGTAAAGHFLSKNWSKLWKTCVDGRTDHWSRGDFLALIEGPSEPHSLPKLVDPELDESEEDRWSLVGVIKPDSEEFKNIPHACPWSDKRKQ